MVAASKSLGKPELDTQEHCYCSWVFFKEGENKVMEMNLSVFPTYSSPSTTETLINKFPGNLFKNVLEKDPMAIEN